jgi:hypothetical protein
MPSVTNALLEAMHTGTGVTGTAPRGMAAPAMEAAFALAGQSGSRPASDGVRNA